MKCYDFLQYKIKEIKSKKFQQRM